MTAPEDSYELSPTQQGMLFHALDADGSGVDLEQVVATLEEPLDAAAFREAWDRVVARHPILRTAFHWEGLEEPRQEVHDRLGLSWERLDWRGVSPEARAERRVAYLAEDRGRGFDLAQPPLMRLMLAEEGPSRWTLVWTFHHALLDGRSFPLVLREVFGAYAAIRAGSAWAPPRPRPYGDYIAWLRGQDLGAAEVFWRRALTGFRAPTPLGIESGRPAEAGGMSACERRLQEPTTEALREFAGANGLTLNTLVQGAWALLLNRYTGEEDVVFGSTRACRRSALGGADDLVGLLINTLPVRVRVSPASPLVPWLRQLREQQVAVRPYEHTPLAKVQAWSEVPRGRPLFESLVVFENQSLDQQLRALGGAWERRRFLYRGQTNYPVTVIGYGDPELLLRLEYDRGRIGDAAAHRMLGHLITQLEGMAAAAADTPIGTLPLLTEEERGRLAGPVASARELSGPCLHERFEEQVAQTPEAVAARCGDAALTYAELNRRANALARRLAALGVGPETLVGLSLERSLDLVVAILGILKAGGAYLPLDPAYPRERLAFMVEDSRVPVIVTQRALEASLPAGPAARVVMEELGPGVEQNPRSGATASNLAYVIYTSGSTGKPKGCEVTHGNVTRLLESTDAWFGFGPQDVWTLFHSYAFDFTVWELWGALLYGGRLVVVPYWVSRSPEAFLDLLWRERVTVLNQTPSAFRQLVQAEIASGSDPEALCLRYVVFGGEALDLQSLRPWYARHGDERPQLVNMYGITETTVHVTYRALTAADVEGGAGSVIGVPIPDLYVRVLDPSGQPVPIGVAGEMYVGGAGVARGYLNRPELTAQRFVPDPVTGDPAARVYRSGDLARWLEDGDLEYLGRIDHQVKIRGFRIELGEIESVLSQHPAVREVVVVAREDAPGDRRLVAYVAADAERGPLAEELRTRLRAVLPDYMVPSAFVFLDSLPLTENGKVDRKALPQPDFTRPPTRAYVAPRNPVEETLATIWGAVLGVPQVGIHDHFFELGGDSILSIQVIARARAAGIRVTPRDLARKPTIAELAAGLEPGRDESVRGSAPATGTAPLTPIQRWFFDLDLAEPHHWNQAFLLESSADLDVARLEAALQAVASHHDVFRLRFERAAAGWRQSYTPEEGRVPLEIADLQALAPEIRASRIEASSAALQSSLDLGKGPLARAALFRCGPEAGCRLLLVLHHLIVDGVSWRILLEDLERAYRGEAFPARTSSYQEWAQRLEKHAANGAFRASLDHWLAPSGSTLPTDLQGENLEASTRTVVVSLDRDQTRVLLQDVPAAFRTQINDALLAALGRAVAAWTGSARNRFDVEGHGREDLFPDIDLSRTLGWFTTIYPVTIAVDPQAGPASALAAVREQVRSVPDRGLSYGVLRHLDADSAPALASIPPAPLLFNYLGQFDQVLAGSRLFRFAEEPIGPWHSPRGRRTHAIEVVVWVKGGCLEARFQYCDQLHHAASIERVARGFRDGLLAIIDAGRSAGVASGVPSDFPLVRVDQAAIDRLARDYAIEDLLPLSPMQRLFYAMDAPGSGLGFEAWRFRLQGPLDPAALRAAWEDVLDRHSILRSAYVSEGLPEPLQVVVRGVKVDWTQEDWRVVPGDEQEARVRERLREGQVRGLDLSRPPLTRLVLLRVAEMTWELLWFTHHLQVDGWSWPLVLRDVSALYAAHRGATPTPLPAALPYRDYLAWLAGSAPDSEAFWRSSLAGLRAPTPVLPNEGRLQTDAADPYGEESVRLSAEASQSLRAFARDRKVTLSTLVQAAWAVALGHWSGEPEVAFGAVFSGRPAELPGIDSMVGPCVNNLPLRVMLPRSQTVAQWLDGRQRHQFEVSQNQYAPLADIQEWAHIPPRLRLFESLIVFQNYLVEAGARSLEADVAIDVVSAPEATNYPVTLTVRPGTELQLRLLYHRDRARPATARAMLADLMTVLHALPVSADAPLVALHSRLAAATAGWAASTRRAPVTARVGPSSQTERRVAAIWAELFEAESVSVDDNFFDLGGHSLLLVRAHARLRGEVDERLPLVALLRYPTVRSLARYLDGHVAPAAPDVVDRASRARAALSRRRAQQEKR